MKKELPFRVKLDVFFDEKMIFDEFGNPGVYESPIVDDHCPIITIDSKPKKRKKNVKLDVHIDEVQYVLKHFPGYLELFKNKGTPKDLYLRMIVEEVDNRN